MTTQLPIEMMVHRIEADLRAARPRHPLPPQREQPRLLRRLLRRSPALGCDEPCVLRPSL